MEKPTQLPKVYVPQRVLKAMVSETWAHSRIETGQSIFGLELTLESPTIVVLGTIPDLSHPNREYGLFQLGGQSQVEIFRWYKIHWEIMRTQSRQTLLHFGQGQTIPVGQIPQEFDKQLTYIGEWHKHPGEFKELSQTDLRQIESIFRNPKEQRDQFLAPIVIYDPVDHLKYKFVDEELVIQHSGRKMKINWYYLHQKDSTRYWKIQPTILPDDQLPWLPPLPWYLKDIARMQKELTLLRQKGCQVGWMVKEMGGSALIQEICFGVDHPEWKRRLMIVTHWDYPKSRPLYQTLPKDGSQPAPPPPQEDWLSSMAYFIKDLFSPQPPNLWDTNRVVFRTPGDPTKYLVDLVETKEGELRVG